jgi:hypothetical protein
LAFFFFLSFLQKHMALFVHLAAPFTSSLNDPYRRLVPRRLLASSCREHLAVVACNVALVVRHYRRKERLEDSFEGIDIRDVDSHCLTWAFEVAVGNLEDSHDLLMGEDLVSLVAVEEDLDDLDESVPSKKPWLLVMEHKARNKNEKI